MVVPIWRSLLQESLEKNSAEPALDYVQLGTVRPYGKPTNKIVQFQSFFNKNPTKDHQKFVSMIMFFVDAKNDDVFDISNGSPYGEVCMFLPITHEIYRLSGRLYIVSSPNNPIYQKLCYNNKIFSKMGYNMEQERIQQWNEYILPIHLDIPNKFEEKNKEAKEKDQEGKDHGNHFTECQSSKKDNVDNENFLSINPRTIKIDDYLNYHNLNKNTMIKRKKSSYDLKSNCTTPSSSTDSNLKSNSKTEGHETGLDISEQMDFKPNQQSNQIHHHHHHSHSHSHSYNHNHNHNHNHNPNQNQSHNESYNDSYYSDPGSKSEGSSGNEYLHTRCNLCQQMVEDHRRRHKTYSLSIEGLRQEMMDNFCLLLLDVNKVYYSNYDYIPLKILEYTRTYSIQEEIMKNSSFDSNNNPNYESLDNPMQMTLKNTYTSLNFENLKNIKFLHSNRLLDSAPLVSDPTPISSSSSASVNGLCSKNCFSTESESEKWDCTTVNYYLTN